PPGSTPHLRALTALSLFPPPDAGAANLATALAEAAARDPAPDSDLGIVTPKLLLRAGMGVEKDVQLALVCASTLQRLEHPLTRLRALTDIEGLARPEGVLGFAGCYAVLRALKGEGSSDSGSDSAAKALEALAGNLRVGIGGPGGEEVEKSVREGVVGVCVGVVRACVVVGGGGEDEVDAGYGSMTDE
ncbi:hypothetical protein V490_00939, partial [Pseudogymnoascus sp. VKM F-3557]